MVLESKQEGYQTLGWIINKSEYGLFLVVADEATQREVIDVYRKGEIGIYDYRQYPGDYSFQILRDWIVSFEGIRTFFIINFQFALQSGQDMKRLNFSRDMLAELRKNLIFFITPNGDDKLAAGAYDFYSFMKLRVVLDSGTMGKKESLLGELSGKESFLQEEWDEAEIRQKMNETFVLMQQAKEAGDKARYQECIQLLLRAEAIRKKILGAEHLEMAPVYCELAESYGKSGEYARAEKLCLKALEIRKNVLDESHPDIAASYNNLANLYKKQGKYREAEELLNRALAIDKKVLGEKHPDTKNIYQNLVNLYK